MKKAKEKPTPRVGDVWEYTVDGGRTERVVVLEGIKFCGNPMGEQHVRLYICNPGSWGGRPMRSRPRLDTFLARYKLVSRVTK